MSLSTRKKWLNFGSHPPPDPDPGIFKGFFSIAIEIGHFSTPKISSHMYPWTRKSPLNFGSNRIRSPEIRSPDPDTDSGSRPYSPWWKYAVSDWCCYWLFWCFISCCSYCVNASKGHLHFTALFSWKMNMPCYSNLLLILQTADRTATRTTFSVQCSLRRPRIPIF